MISRRKFVSSSAALLVAGAVSRGLATEPESILVNDLHSQLNPTRVLGVLQPRSSEDVQEIIRSARKDHKVISIAGGRHAMGGQEFGTDTLLIDVRGLNRILDLNHQTGVLEVEAGIEWPGRDRFRTGWQCSKKGPSGFSRAALRKTRFASFFS
jgi:FAD/FMN-containing dehydrogenase